MKIITIETLKTFLDELNKKYGTEFYSKVESDNRYQQKGESSSAGVDAFYQWLKERNYDLTNFQGLEGTFPVKDFPEIKTEKLAGGDTQIIGTGAPNTTVEYDGKQTKISKEGYFLLYGISPLVDGNLIQLICYDYAGRKKIFSAAVGNIDYAVPDGTTEITKDTVEQYNLDRTGNLILPLSVKVVRESAFSHCSSLTSISLPSCTSVGANAFGDCSSLTSISLPSCTSVEVNAFSGCSSLTSISLPSCTSVGDHAFAESDNLSMVILSDVWTPNYNADISTAATVYNQDKTKKIDWETETWVNV